MPLGFVLNDFVSRGFEDRFFGRDQRQVAVGAQRGGWRHGPGIPCAGEPLHVLNGLHNYQIEAQRLHFGQQSPLPTTRSRGVIIEVAHSLTNLSQQALTR